MKYKELLIKKNNFLIDLIRLNKIKYIKTKGKSMLPTINEGEVIFLNSLVDNAKIGDIVLYCNDYNLVLHRIIDCVDNNWVIKGDNEEYIEIVPKKEIISVFKGKRIENVDKDLKCLNNIDEKSKIDIIEKSIGEFSFLFYITKEKLLHEIKLIRGEA